MITDLKTTIGYKCANCNRNNYKDISIFDINSQKSVPLTCVCGAHLGEVRYKSNHSYVIHAMCCFCAEPHSFYIKRKNFWHTKLLSYPCPTALLTYVAIGNTDKVHQELKQADTDFEELLANMQEATDDNGSDQAMFQVLEKIQTMDTNGKLACDCGNHELLIDMQDDEIIILCNDCGKQMTIDTANEEEVKEFLQLDSLLLTNKHD